MMDLTKEIADMKVSLAALEAKAKKTKFTPVSFESQGELALALWKGETFLTYKNATLYYEEAAGKSPFRMTEKGYTISCAMGTAWDLYSNLWRINT
jgi:hypothetical protein